MGHRIGRDIFVSLVVTAIGTVLAWSLIGGIPVIGIDDAAITRSYAENLAQGAGYVYNVGGERVEGSTALLWVLILTAAYLVTPTPEYLILGLSVLLTLGAVLAVTRISRCLTERLRGSGNLAVLILAVLLLASPGYFLWSVWTMMEIALWSAVVMWLILHLVTRVEDERAGGAGLGLFLPALMLPLIRPEGVAVAFGLIALGILLAPAPALRRQGLVALGLVFVVFVAVTAFRMGYFGQPFPNTFYAKVSSDRLQDLKDGLKYAASFVLGAPFVAPFVAAWAAAAAWGLLRIARPLPGNRGTLIVGAAVFGFLAIYAALGGDHFALWRFYQPIAPLLPVALAVAAACAVSWVGADRPWSVSVPLSATAGVLAVFAMGWLHFYQARFDVRKEFVLVEDGLGFGRYLNGVEPRPSIGVGPAGGIALAYDGQIYDLLGLNWTEMAHANPIKVGLRNHASFDKGTFWEHRPEVLATFNRPCTGDGTQAFWGVNDDAFDGLFEDQRFREAYLPVLFREGSTCWPGFAVPGWLDAVPADAGVERLTWSDIRILN